MLLVVMDASDKVPQTLGHDQRGGEYDRGSPGNGAKEHIQRST